MNIVKNAESIGSVLLLIFIAVLFILSLSRLWYVFEILWLLAKDSPWQGGK